MMTPEAVPAIWGVLVIILLKDCLNYTRMNFARVARSLRERRSGLDLRKLAFGSAGPIPARWDELATRA